jgi:K(+)-stimulated pyrophosphate-energized sodium pump
MLLAAALAALVAYGPAGGTSPTPAVAATPAEAPAGPALPADARGLPANPDPATRPNPPAATPVITPEAGTHTTEPFKPFNFLSDPNYSNGERAALIAVVLVALLGLGYAGYLVREVYAADPGTERMQQIAGAIREGAYAYLGRQFSIIGPLIVLLAVILYLTGRGSGEEIAWGRAVAFLMGAAFSGLVGFVGMTLATTGNLRVAAAARKSFGGALQVGYRAGTVTGMLTDGLGLLGGSLIFLFYGGDRAYEVLLGFGFGGTLLALFMRVGGGIYTKAADVGADLVGKIEKDIPEDDPRNAATIADNVGDNVGDCAGMAADVFESYEVTIVAAMILGYATYGLSGVIFPLLVRAVGVIASMVGTYTVKADEKGTAAEAMHRINVGFWISAAVSIAGFMLVGFLYLRHHATDPGFARIQGYVTGLPGWATLGVEGLDMRPAWACLIGIFLAIVLNKCTEYFTGTEYEPVRSLTKSCRTGHATNIIQGFAVGYESTVWAVLIIAAAIFASVAVFAPPAGVPLNPMFVAYGVAMTGIGMLTLTGDTISMDVFGPIADNANGIGEMGYDRAAMGDAEYKTARQTLSDLDAVGNTTKAITKGIAIGSAVIAAVSLFASFIAVLAGAQTGLNESDALRTLTVAQFSEQAAKLSVAIPEVFVGFLIGGAVPFLFSSMTIRAVGRAAGLIVQECRAQFRDPAIWNNTKKPDYGRVVGICTATAQKELVGPGLLAIFTPVLIGFLLGPYALGGFLAGMILTGQLLAVFMANAGGAWDNCKKMIEDGLYGGKGSDAHKAAVTGDTVGDPLKDTAGPAVNPLIKVMNMVSLLALPLVLQYHVGGAKGADAQTGWIVALISLAAVAWAWWSSKHEGAAMKQMEATLNETSGSATPSVPPTPHGSPGQ